MGPILITGAGGAVGRALTPALRRAGWEVVTTSLTSPGTDVPGVDLSIDAGPLFDRVRPEVVVHLAGGTAGDAYRTNVFTTARVLEAGALLSSPPYYVVLGSAAEYGESSQPLGETSPLRPVTEYGKAKAAQTALARNIACLKLLNLTVLRPFNIVSPDLPDTTALGRMRRLLLASTGPEPALSCGRLDIVRDYVPMGFLIDAIAKCIELRPDGRTINVCSGTPIMLGDIVDEMAAGLGLQPRLTVDPELASIPAADSVVGDPAELSRHLGISCTIDAATVARLLVG